MSIGLTSMPLPPEKKRIKSPPMTTRPGAPPPSLAPPIANPCLTCLVSLVSLLSLLARRSAFYFRAPPTISCPSFPIPMG
ncbi:hypothetical protein L228DRAFT_244664 [Xylona heveae TC161]|uniref:Uncharacterized protein n=1 Tax=Xylona heveae (strain CBS 132557 / TC161) TaxID=1328760 RepID=A0A165J5J5_XYLHT|nr:hypothetical protein L228DRAFT_244664 [Xylona heveae TC161]KZF25759.1 hypothetical protein L228DRAFT_244664 [Xylona heveae TC161]